jgi:hypothetical protein
MQKVIWLWALLVLCGLSGFSRADPSVNDWSKQELILFNVAKNQTPDSTKQSGQLFLREGLRRLQSADAGGLEKFSSKAQLAWVTQQQSVVANARNFIWPSDFSQVAQGWAGQGSQYVWRRQSSARPTPLNLSLTAAIAKQPFQLDDYDELWIDYTPTPSVKRCVMQLQFQGLLQPYDKKILPKTVMWNTGRNTGFKVLEMLDVSHAAFKAKDYSYLLGRVLGLAPDEDWRFVQNQKNTVVQRRMHLKLDNAHALEIAFAAGAGVERVNLLVSRKDDHGEGELLEFAVLSPDATLPDGHRGVRLDLRDALAQRFPREWEENSKEAGTNSFYLQEVFLYFPGDAQTVAASKPVRRLTLLEWAEKSVQDFRALTSQVVGINASRQRLAVNIRELGTMGHVDLTQANLRLYSPEDAASCAVRINDIRAVNTYNSQVPAFAENLEGWVRSRGGPFVRMLPEQGQVEQPGIVNYLPLSTLFPMENTKSKTQINSLDDPQKIGPEIKQMGTNVPLPDFRVLTEAGKDVALENKRISINNGAKLAFQGMEPTISRDGDSLVLKGDSDSLEITWPMATRLFENTWFYFGVPEGAEQMADMSLTAEFADGHHILRRVEPNKPLRIDSGGAQLTKLRLSLALRAKPFRIKLRELALFSPKIATYGEARMLPLPLAMYVKPKPTLTEGTQRLMESGPGYATGLLGNEPVRFVTLLDKHLNWVESFNLGFRFPLGAADEGRCPLTMQLNWANGQTLRQFCPANMEGSIRLPLANLLGAENQGRNLGALKSIEWMVAASGSRVGDMQEAFSLNFAVQGWAMVSAMDQVRLSPLIQAGKEEVYADMPKIENALSDAYLNSFWLPLEATALDKIAAMKGEILPVKHPLFTLNKIVAEPKQPIDLARWVTLFDPPAHNASPRWPKLLLWVSVIFLVWVAWKKEWWSMGGLGRIFLGMGKVLFGLARITIQWLMRLLWRLLPWLNLMVGVFALGPGLWLAGRLGTSIQGGMLLIGLILVLWGVYSHWRGGTSRIWHEGGWIALTLFAGCAVWSLGNFGLQYDAAWGVLPLMGTVYALLPLLYQRLLLWWQDKPHPLLLAAWTALTLVLYGIGLTLKVGSGENYFFTFGGMAVVMVVREFFLVVEPRFRLAFPNIANPVYGGAGRLYFSGALVLLVGTATMLSLKLELIAEQLAVVVYYCLVVGTVLEIVALRRAHNDHSGNLDADARPIEAIIK